MGTDGQPREVRRALPVRPHDTPELSRAIASANRKIHRADRRHGPGSRALSRTRKELGTRASGKVGSRRGSSARGGLNKAIVPDQKPGPCHYNNYSNLSKQARIGQDEKV